MKHQLVILCVYRQSGSQKFRVVFEIVLKKKVEIHWGDGCQSVLSAQTGSKIEHYYTTDDPDEWFNIEIFSESPDAMLEFHSESYEFGICAVSFWHCDSLKIIDIKHLSGPYLFACLDLEELYLDYYGNEVLWLPGCPLLKQLQCNFSTTLEVVDLTSSTYLERLEIRHCTRLIEIIGGVRLRNVNHQWTKLSEQTSLNLETIFSKNVKMYRVVALGAVAGEIVDRLRATGNYDDIRFVYCDTDKEHLMSHGKKMTSIYCSLTLFNVIRQFMMTASLWLFL